MKNYKLKKLYSFIGALLSALMFISFSVGALYDVNKENELIEDTNDIYSIIVDEFSKTTNYGGAYFNNKILYIATTNIEASEKVKKELISSINHSKNVIANVSLNKVKYSYAELSEVRDYITENMEKLSVVGTYTDPKKNAVVVELVEAQENSVELLKQIIGFDNIVVNIVPDLKIVDDATYIRGGYELKRVISSTSSGRGSLGCGIKWSNGDIGFLTTSHGAGSIGDDYKYGSIKIGEIASIKNSGSIDATLIKRTDSSFLPSNKNGSSGVISNSSGSPIVNDDITMYGYVSNSSTGTVIAIDYAVGGFTGMIKADYSSQSGDSGGALIVSRTSGNVFIGINKGRTVTSSGEIYGLGTKWTTISSQYKITRVVSTES